MKAWMRILEVTLTSRKMKRQMVFGSNWRSGKDDLNIDIVGNKYMSTLKDSCTIKLSNLTYSELVQIISGEFYDVTVKCGYRDANVQTIFDGGVLYISNSLDDKKTNTVVILCASKLVARYGQSRINLTLNSGINMYSAVKFVCRRAGIMDATISEQLKKTFLQDIMNVNDTVGSWIEKLTQTNNSFIVNSDSSIDSNSIVSLFNANKSNARIITLRNDQIDLSGGYPRLTSDGISLTILPTFAFMCGDVIKIDNALLNISTGSSSEVSKNYGHYLDKDGCYMIYEMEYRLQNRSSEFSLNITAKSRNLISSYMGG